MHGGALGWTVRVVSDAVRGASGAESAARTLRATKLPAKMSCSETGRTRGPRLVMLRFNAMAATFISSRPILTPTLPVSSSFWMTTLQHAWQRQEHVALLTCAGQRPLTNLTADTLSRAARGFSASYTCSSWQQVPLRQ